MQPDYRQLSKTFDALLNGYERITIISHIHPDADAIGTALGVYHWLRERGRRVEVANASADVPRYLDFLPGFGKIKTRIDFDDSLIISCDCGSIDRLGFDLEGRTIVNIDHHASTVPFGTLNVVDSKAVASAEVAYYLLTDLHPLSAQSATAFYAALVSDTRNFTTGNMNAGVFALAQELVGYGVNIPEVTRQMLHRRSLASLRILGEAIASLELVDNAQIAIMTVRREDRLRWGARISDLDGIVDYGRSLVTVRIALMLAEYDGYIKVSLRSKGLDVLRIARHFGGGGHREAAGFEVEGGTIEQVRTDVLTYIRSKRWPE